MHPRRREMVEEESSLPGSVCRQCSEDVITAVKIRQLCVRSLQHWTEATNLFFQIKEPTIDDKNYFVFYNDDKRTVVIDQIERLGNEDKPLKRLNDNFKIEIDSLIPKRQKKRHMLAHCQCPDCGKRFTTLEGFNHHLKATMKLACIKCGDIIPKKNMAKHFFDDHGIIVFECGICYMNSDSKEEIKEHYIESHGPNMHSCKICGSGFSNERALRAHQYIHTLFHCNRCGKSFENNRCYKYHQTQCKTIKEKPLDTSIYRCDECGVEYDKKPSLRIHIVQKHVNILPYVCEVCGKRTSTVAHLKTHEKIHNKQRKIFECYCGAKLSTELGFRLHQRIHSGVKPYECEQCGERFLSSSRRLDHVKRRHKKIIERLHCCDRCSAKFVRPWELKKHYLNIHYTVVDVKRVERNMDPKTRRLRNKYKLIEEERRIDSAVSVD